MGPRSNDCDEQNRNRAWARAVAFSPDGQKVVTDRGVRQMESYKGPACDVYGNREYRPYVGLGQKSPSVRTRLPALVTIP